MANENWIKHAYPLQKITVQLQGTRHSSRDAIIDQLEVVLARLKSGLRRAIDAYNKHGLASRHLPTSV